MTQIRPQIVIPMSGFGERFRRAGYDVPKPLIEVDGKPIIQHVVELFPGAIDFVFICNQDHLAEPRYRMREILAEIAPAGRVVAIAPHRLGPVHAVQQVVDQLEPGRPVIVNYCDFTCFWHYDDFLAFAEETGCDGAIPAYRGFHPHSLGSTFYAYLKDQAGWATDIQEKQPFTDDPTSEFASSGTYYFASAELLKHYCDETVRLGLSVGDEYYVSLVYKPMLRDGRAIAVYPLQHFMQWGTPDDLQEYQYWSRIFSGLIRPGLARQPGPVRDGLLLVPMAGLGQRFAVAGYQDPKPLVPVSGRPMVVQAALDMPRHAEQRFILRADLAGKDRVTAAIAEALPKATFQVLDGVTDGQARTCLLGLADADPEAPLTIIACDNGALYDGSAFAQMVDHDSADVVVWGARGHPQARRKPQMFGWIDAATDGRIRAVSTKVPLADPAHDPIVIGAFSFRRAGDFLLACERMMARQATVNGEYYVDVAINDALALGLDCRLFEAEAYLCWGTPDDLRTFDYWQSCFDKWQGHPYRLDLDSRIEARDVAQLRESYRWSAPERPPARRD